MPVVVILAAVVFAVCMVIGLIAIWGFLLMLEWIADYLWLSAR